MIVVLFEPIPEWLRSLIVRSSLNYRLADLILHSHMYFPTKQKFLIKYIWLHLSVHTFNLFSIYGFNLQDMETNRSVVRSTTTGDRPHPTPPQLRVWLIFIKCLLLFFFNYYFQTGGINYIRHGWFMKKKKTSKNLEVSRGIFTGQGVSSQLYSKFTYRPEAPVYSTTSLINYMQNNLDTRLDGQKDIYLSHHTLNFRN